MPSQSLRSVRPMLPALALALVAVLSACGRKEPPQPPPSRVPAAPQELGVTQRGEDVLLSFPFPTTTIGGLALETFVAAEIYELVREVPEGFFDEPEPEEAEESESDPEEGAEDEEADSREGSEATEEGDEGSQARDDEDEDEEERPSRRKPRKKVYTVEKSEFAAGAQVRLRLEGADLAAATEGNRIATRFRLQEISPDTLVAHIFGVRILVDDDKLISPFSRFTTLIPKVPPPAPTALAVDATERGVRLAWASDTVAAPEEEEAEPARSGRGDEAVGETDTAPEAPDDEPATEPGGGSVDDPLAGIPGERQILGFHVYRRLAQEPSFGEPVQKVDAGEREWLDRSAPFDQRYVYAVTAIRELDPVIESAIGEEREVDYRDTFPPPVPRNVAALAERARVRVLWTPRPADDLAGYLVYRVAADGSERLLTPVPVVHSEYIDTEITSGERVSYFVVSIDHAGNRSDRSKTTETTVP